LLQVSYLRSEGRSIARREVARARKKDKYALVEEKKEAATVDRRMEFEEKEDKASDRICTPCSRYAER
jgi:c-di-AMP phosphodiesterase-like protein